MKKVFGIIHFISLVGGIIFCIYIIIWDYSRLQDYESLSDAKDIPPSIIFIVLLSIGIYYVVATKFGAAKSKLLEDLDKENEIIKKQIEKKELLSKLESLEKK